MLVVNNLKIERIAGKKFKPKFITVGPDLFDLLNELGYKDLKGSALYIIESNRKVKHTTIINALSKGFSLS